jgi:hypothetical protein
MPWCPKCKTEYQEGYTQCKDCKVELVEELEDLEEAMEFVPFYQAEDEKTADKLASFFEYSGIPSKVEFDDEYEVYSVMIPPEAEKDARKFYAAFYYVETERMLNEKANGMNSEPTDLPEESEEAAKSLSEEEDTSDSEYEEDTEEEEYAGEIPSDDISVSGVQRNDGRVYIMKSDQYKDLTGTVWIFLFFGVVGLIFVILNATGIITLLNGWLPNLVMGALFVFFLFVAMSTSKKAKMVRSEIDAENLMTRDITNWLKTNVTKEFLASLHNDSISEEANYIRYTDHIKELLIKEFGNQNLSYLDRIIEEFYNETFEVEEE